MDQMILQSHLLLRQLHSNFGPLSVSNKQDHYHNHYHYHHHYPNNQRLHHCNHLT